MRARLKFELFRTSGLCLHRRDRLEVGSSMQWDVRETQTVSSKNKTNTFAGGQHLTLLPQWNDDNAVRVQYRHIAVAAKYERLSGPCWLTYSEWFTHINGYPSSTGRAQDREVRMQAKDRCSTAVPRNQLEQPTPK